MDYKKFNRTATPEDIETLRDYRKDLNNIKVRIHTISNDMQAVGVTQKMMDEKQELFRKETKVNQQIENLLGKYECN